MRVLFYLIYVFVAYLLGSIPFGYLISKMKGIDIRSKGSGNIGATNVFRVLGWQYGLIVFILDVLKGFLPTYYVEYFTEADFYLSMIVGIAALIGHIFPLFLRFKGGKGVATGLGVFMGLAPTVAMWVLGVFLIVFLTFGYVSLGSIMAAVSLPIAILIYNSRVGDLEAYPWYFIVISFLIALFIVYRHKSNIVRLLKGEESRILYKRENKGVKDEDK